MSCIDSGLAVRSGAKYTAIWANKYKMQRRVVTTGPRQRGSVGLQAPTAMVNYRRIVCEVALLCGVFSAITAAPACDEKDHKLVYDQRQNGTENYRLNIDGVVIAVAPAESFLSALSDIDFSDLIDLESLEQELKPKPPTTSVSLEDLPVPKPEDKPVLDAKPEKPVEAMPDEKPLESMPEVKPQESEAPSKIDDVSVEPSANLKGHKKSAQLRKQETTQRLKHRIASIFLPFLRKRRHQ